jgi:hypothetical protein
MMNDRFYVRLSQLEIIDSKTGKAMVVVNRLLNDGVSIDMPEGMPINSADWWLDLVEQVKSAMNMFMDR